MCSILSALESTLAEPDMDILYNHKYNTKGDMVYEEEDFSLEKDPFSSRTTGSCSTSNIVYI